MGARPSPTAAFPERDRRSDVADAPCEWERSAAGPVRAPGWASGAERRRRAEKGAGKEGAPAVLQCSAAPSPPARPRSAARHCGNADGKAPPGLGRTGPGIPCPVGPHPAPGAPGCRSPPLPQPRFVFLPPLPGPRDVSSCGGTQSGGVPGISRSPVFRGCGGSSSCLRR